MSSPDRLQHGAGSGTRLVGALIALVLPLAPAAVRSGEITATVGTLSLGTTVNGQPGGSCLAGACTIGGGSMAASSLFHRFTSFDTRGAIQSVLFDSQGRGSVVVGVTDPFGSFIDKPISFTTPAALIWLSPGGIHLGAGASFVHIPELRLSTATGMQFGGGSFDALHTTTSAIASLRGDPLPSAAALYSDSGSLQAAGLPANADISLSGALLSVDRSLLLDARGGNLQLQGSTLQATGDGEGAGSGGRSR